MRDWQEKTLEEISESIDYGLTASAETAATNCRFLRITDIVNQLNWSNVPYVTVSITDEKKYKLNHGDIVIARTGATTGASFYIKNPPNAVFASYLVRYKIKPEHSPRYVSYFLQSHSWWSYIKGVLGDKSAQPNASASTMAQVRLPIPPLHEQKAIAAVLGVLDDKIELNRRMNATLEAMARALFKSWFVDFDPVRAKMAGKQPFGMDATTAALFPSRLVPSPLGDIPEGWDMPKFSDLFDVIGGGTPKTSVEEYWNGDIPWFSVVDAPSDSDVFVLKTDKSITQKGVDESSTKILPIGTTIISARGTVGRLALVGKPMAMNQSCYGLSPAKGIGASFLYFSTKKAVAELKSHAHGSVFDTITRDTFDGISAIKPSADIVSAFEAMAWPMLEKIKDSLAENIKLEKTRDYLLPKLISGDIRIPDAEKFVEAA